MRFYSKEKRNNSFVGAVRWLPFFVFGFFYPDFRKSFERLTWSRARMDERRLKKVQEIIAYAFEHSVFYRDFYTKAGVHPNDIKTLKDVEKLPILTKTLLRKAIADKTIFTAKKQPWGTLETSTAGSSGDPLVLYLDFPSRMNKYIAMTRTLWTMGAFPNKRFALVWRKKKMNISQWLGFKLGMFKEIGVIDVADSQKGALGKDEAKKIVEDMIAFHPQAVRGYVSALWVIAQLVKKYDLDFNPETIIAAAEYLPPTWWSEMEKTFKCPVHNLYGGTEASPIAASMVGTKNLTVFQDVYHTEIVDEKGFGVATEIAGRVIVTDQASRYMPIIRYEIGDIAQWADDQSGPFPFFKHVHGRINDIFVLPGGKILFSHNWHVYFRDVSCISKMKVIQRSTDVIDIFLQTDEPDMPWNDELEAVKQEVEKSLGTGVTVNWKLVNKIELDPRDKFRSTKSEIDQETILKNL